MGWIPGRVPLAGGPDVNESELEEVVLWAPEEEAAGSSGVSEEEEEGPGPSPRMYLSLVSPLVFSFALILRRRYGCRRPGYPTMTAQAGPG